MEGRNTPSPKLDGMPNMSVDMARRRAVVSPRTVTADTRNFIVEKELLESQMRKIQLENSTLHTENKLLKDKYNRATARISELESQLSSLEEELEGLQDNMAAELSRVARQSRAEAEREIEQRQSRITSLSKENEKLQNEARQLQQKLESALKETETVKKTSDRTRALDAQKEENMALKAEIKKLQELLSASEEQLEAECHKSADLNQQLAQLTEVKDILQLQLDAGGSTGSAAEKRVLSLEQRLRLTEERLTQERADRASNLSQVEEKLLADNAKLQAAEKELGRQLQREKDKTRSLEQRSHDYREENMKLRLSLPDEDETIASHRVFDIPNSSHSSQRHQTKKLDNVKMILKELEKEGVSEGEEGAAIVWLWNQRQQQQKQLREWRVYLTDLQLIDKDTSEGLKVLREKLSEYENKFKEIEEKMEDVQAEKVTIDSTYKQQLSILVKERHEGFARLKTLEDLMDALRKENELLRQGLSSTTTAAASDNKTANASEAQLESLQMEIQTLESRSSQLLRKNKALEMEMDTLRAQVTARDIALEEAFSELKAAQAQRSQGEETAFLREKVENLSSELVEAEQEKKGAQQRAESLQRDKQRLEGEVEEAQRQLQLVKARQAKQGAAREEGKEAKMAMLEGELEEKEMQVMSLTSQLRQVEVELDTAQHQLVLQREAASALQAQVEEAEAEIQDKGEIIDTITDKKSELLEQLTLVKTRLDAANLSLSHKHSQLQVLQMELKHEREHRGALEDRVGQQPGKAGHGEMANGTSGGQSETVLELRLHEMDTDMARLKSELRSTTGEVCSLQEERETQQQEQVKVREELVQAQALSCQLNTKTASLQQDLETLTQEHGSLREEHQQAEEHLVKMGSRLQEVLHKFELEARRKHGDFATQYAQLTPDDGPKVLAELHTLRLLTGEKDKEVSMLNDKISRQDTQARHLENRVTALLSTQARSKEDVGRLTRELVHKMKESAATAEVNQVLVKEQTALQKEHQKLQQSVDEERSHKERHKAHISDVIKKVERSELTQKETSQMVQQKDSLIAEVEAELRQVKRSLGQMEVENEQLKSKVDHLQEDIGSLGNVNAALEKRLEMERASLAEEKTNSNKRREDLATANHRVEDLKHEQTMLLNNLSAERKNVQKLKEDIQSQEEAEKKLQGQIQSLMTDVETQHGQLLACRQQIEQLKLEKDAFYKDYQDVCRQLGEKDRLLTEQQRQSEHDVEAARKEIERLISSQEKEKGQLDLELVKARDEVTMKQDLLRQKELQLTSFGRTLQDLEEATKEKKDLEVKVERLQSSADESRLLVESMRHEIMTLKDSNAQLQESLGKSQVKEVTLQDELRSVRDAGDGQAMELRHMMEGMKAHHEFERKALRESLQQLETQVKSTEGDLRAALEREQDVAEARRGLQRDLESLTAQLAQEAAAHKLAQDKVDALKAQMTDAKKSKFTSEEKMLELQASVKRVEADLTTERERTRSLAISLQEAEGAVEAKNASLRGKHEQVEVLKNEVSKLQQVMGSQKQQLAARMRQSAMDMKQQVDSTESERIKLAQQAQQMSVELEQVREQLALKSKENLKLQEEMLTLEDQVREHSSKLRTTQVTLQHEEEMQVKLSSRFQEQEEELRKLRAFLAGKADEEGDGNTMWKEMNRVMQDLSQQLLKHMEEARGAGQDGKDRDSRQLGRLRRELSALESQLNAERALHAITKNAVQSLEEDNARLRQQLHQMRRRGRSHEKKHRSRMEEINEIIARSQSRAQAMMASGAYLDGTFKYLNPSRDFNTSSATLASRDGSPDTSLALSDTSFTSAGMFSSSMLNLSTPFPPVSSQK
ncbi:uncharacterized protein LOC143296965 [Babylonia areolata]|uniref:uncharacterized protein LOC143296965 n=1 Tax=Babylonia areolata TaxID=304850 RepID=UPI003FD34CE0